MAYIIIITDNGKIIMSVHSSIYDLETDAGWEVVFRDVRCALYGAIRLDEADNQEQEE